MDETYSVVRFFNNGNYNYIVRGVSAEEAAKKAESLIKSVSAKTGVVKRIIITDSGDFTALEWEYGKGLLFPLKCSNAECKSVEVLADTPCKSCGTITKPLEV